MPPRGWSGANEFESAYVRPIIFLGSRRLGAGPEERRGSRPPSSRGSGAPTWARRGSVTVSGSRSRLGGGSRTIPFPNAKATGTYINSILAKRDAVADGYDEALMLNIDGAIAEGSGENLFVIRDGVIYTPPLSAGCLDGVTRNAVMTLLSDDGYTVIEKVIHRS